MSWVYRRPSDPRRRRKLVPPATRGAAAQTITGVLFTRAPTFATGDVQPQPVTLTGVLFTRAPTFPTGQVNLQLNGVLFTRAPTFAAGQVDLQLNGVTFTRAPTFPAGQANLRLNGVLFTRAPTFPAGSVASVLAGVLFTRAPTFPTGAVQAQPVTLTGVLFTRAPTFATGSINLQLVGATFTRAPTFPTGSVDLRLAGVLFTRAPTFATGRVNLRILGAVFALAPTFPTGDISLATGDQTITGVLFTRAPTFPTGAVNAQPVTLTGVLFAQAPTFATGQIDLRLAGVLFTRAGTFPTGAVNAQPVTVNGVLFTLAPTFPTGIMRLSALSFWVDNKVATDISGRSLILPGLTGHFADTPDINLMASDEAHIFQSIGLWNAIPTGATHTLTPVANPETFSGFAKENVATLSTGVRIRCGAADDSENVAPVVGGQTYSFATLVFLERAGTITYVVRWNDGAGGPSGGPDHFPGAVAQPAGWAFATTTAVAPAGALSFALELRVEGNNIGDDIKVGQSITRDGATSTFVPSLRIVGDVDMEMLMAADNWASGEQLGIGNRSGNFGYETTFGAADTQIFGRHGTGAARATAGVFLAGKVDGQYSQMRAYFDISAGEWNFVQDAESDLNKGGFSTLPGAPVAAGAAIDVGARDGTGVLFSGRTRWAETRDGIGGPVVARFDAADFIAGDSDGATAIGSIDGRTWTLHGAATRITSGGPVRHTDNNVGYAKLVPSVSNPL